MGVTPFPADPGWHSGDFKRGSLANVFDNSPFLGGYSLAIQ